MNKSFFRVSSFNRSYSRLLYSQTPTMSRHISLTPEEHELRVFLLDVAEYVGSLEGYTKPQLRFTGGWVRDKLLGVTSHDIDIGISSLTGEKFSDLMRKYLLDPSVDKHRPPDVLGNLSIIKENPDRSKHLETARTKIFGIEVDLVNLRKETYSDDSRNPIMEFGSPEEDASRRDATVNALFYNLSSEEVEDPTGKGLSDMELKKIRTPLEPFQTFKDDPLRILRCIRFAGRLGYSIDAAVLRCMNDPEILNALRLKISRERIGVEISKMLKGPNPRHALSLIDSLGLYDVIFTDPSEEPTACTDTADWSMAYGMLSRMLDSESPPLSHLASMLIREGAGEYMAWLMASVAPLSGRKSVAPAGRRKPTTSLAAHAAREGLKLDNVATCLIDDASHNLTEIISMKTDFLKGSGLVTLPRKRPLDEDVDDREKFGMAIRRWSRRNGSNWRLSVLHAFLVEQIREGVSSEGALRIAAGYETWLVRLAEMDLLEVGKLQPVVNGKDLMKETGRKGGPWLAEALDTVIRWQLRNPASQDKASAIAEVINKFKA